MSVVKRTYALPRDALQAFEQEVPAEKRNAVLGELLSAWLERQRAKKLREEIIAGCEEMTDIYLATEREFHPLEEEVQRALDGPPTPRRHRARTTRSRARIRAGR